MEFNNTKIHFETGVKMFYLFPQIPPLPIPWQRVVVPSIIVLAAKPT